MLILFSFFEVIMSRGWRVRRCYEVCVFFSTENNWLSNTPLIKMYNVFHLCVVQLYRLSMQFPRCPVFILIVWQFYFLANPGQFQNILTLFISNFMSTLFPPPPLSLSAVSRFHCRFNSLIQQEQRCHLFIWVLFCGGGGSIMNVIYHWC